MAFNEEWARGVRQTRHFNGFGGRQRIRGAHLAGPAVRKIYRTAQQISRVIKLKRN
jgi:hypothetical protein